MSRPRLIALLLALVTLMVYLPVTQHDFLPVYDDGDYVTNNWFVQQGLTWVGVKWAFTTFHAANWHPLTWLSHMVDCELFGLNAGAIHFINALFHAANSALLMVVFWRMTGQIRPALVIAALFAWHPLHVETVAWVAERKDVLSTFFVLLALLPYIHYAQAGHRRGYWLALSFFACSLLAKPMYVTFPFLLLLLDYWPLGRITSLRYEKSQGLRLIQEKIPFLVLAAVSCGLTMLAQRAGGAVSSFKEWPWSNRLDNAVVSTGRYLLKLCWPVDLAAVYPWAPVAASALILAVATLLVVSAAVWHWRSHRHGIVGWLWFLGTLIPVIGLVQVGHAAMADRYTYFPSVGIFAALVFGAYQWAGHSPFRRKLLTAVECLILAACLCLTEKQLGYWRDTETLFRHTLAVTANNSPAHLCLGVTYDLDGRYADALVEYRETLRLSPQMPKLRLTIGDVLVKLGQTNAALAEYRRALRTEPQDAALHDAIGEALASQGDLAAATTEFQEAVRLNPHLAQPHLEMAKIRFASGQTTEAAYELLAATRAGPNDFHILASVAYCLAANADSTARDPQTALLMARKAAELSANQQPEAFDVMGVAFAAAGDFTNAIICAQKALALVPVDRANDTAPLRRRLERYQNHQPWLESFRATNLPPGQ